MKQLTNKDFGFNSTQVRILPQLPAENSCQTNCSVFGATCVYLDPEAIKMSCVCPNGILLDAFNPKCNDGLFMFSIYAA